MGFGNYDAWKLRSPDDDVEERGDCGECGGRGQVYLSPCYYPCQSCHGTGHLSEDDREYEPLDGDEDEFFGAGLPLPLQTAA